MRKILAIIPARAGSKSIPHKNIRPLLGKPLMAYSIEHALQSKHINRVIVSTDDEHYAEIAREYGAEAPFLRPADISADTSVDLGFFIHALDWLDKNENYIPEICVQLRPTHPVRNPDDIDKMITMLLDNPGADSVRSVVENKTIIPYKMWLMEGESNLMPLLHPDGLKEPYNSPRQALPKTYFQNASVDVIRTDCIRKKNSLSGDVILGYVMDEQFDIDYADDFDKVERYLLAGKIRNGELKNHTICIDIDGVIATLTPGNDYSLAEQVPEVAEFIRLLYDNGNRIILYTARGSMTGIDWKAKTTEQLKQWAVPYHELHFGKPAADVYIDDRAMNIFDIIPKK